MGNRVCIRAQEAGKSPAGRCDARTVLWKTAMSATHPHNKTMPDAAEQSDELRLLDLGNSPTRYTLTDLLEMSQPTIEIVSATLDEDVDRFYALAEIEVVQSTGDTVYDHHDGFVVLYATADLSHATEVFFRADISKLDDVPRVRDVSLTDADVDVMSDETAANYRHIIRSHAEVDYAIEKRHEAMEEDR